MDKGQRKDSAIEAIKFALKTDDGLTFLHCWMYGEFNTIRNEWPECPAGVFTDCEVST